MEMDVKSMHPLEIRLLRHVSSGEDITAERLIRELDYQVGHCNQAFSWLIGRGYIEETERVARTLYELTELGMAINTLGFPGERMLQLLDQHGPLSLPEITERLGLPSSDIGSAFGQLSKAGVLAMTPEKLAEIRTKIVPKGMLTARELVSRGTQGPIDEASLTDEERSIMQTISKKRGAAAAPFRVTEREELHYRLTQEGAAARTALIDGGITGDELGAVTPAILASGVWKEKDFRWYSLNAPTTRLMPGRKNPYAAYLQWVKDKLVSLGFEEFDGPLVETEFWNGDALFMPQFHSARDIHDVYYVKNPSQARTIEQPYLDQVASTHEDGWQTGSRGWGYSFDRDFTRRQVMRSQGTVLSAKQLPKANVPGKYFGVARCFRYDQVDATHGADFYQTEGIVLGEDVNLRTLLGLLKMFAEEVAGAEEVRYVPGYFPFTEPSIEIHIKHPVLGWFELGGSGIFRPEVTKALGIDVPVLAWGLGIDRMALMHLGLNDLRDLFTPDIESVRMRRGK